MNNYTETHKKEILNAIDDILGRGNDAEIKTCKDGIKIIEIKRRVHSKIEGEEFKSFCITTNNLIKLQNAEMERLAKHFGKKII